MHWPPRRSGSLGHRLPYRATDAPDVRPCASGAASVALEFKWQTTRTRAHVQTILPPPVSYAGGRTYPYPDLALCSVTVDEHPCVKLTTSNLFPGSELYVWGYTDDYPGGDSALFRFGRADISRRCPIQA